MYAYRRLQMRWIKFPSANWREYPIPTVKVVLHKQTMTTRICGFEFLNLIFCDCAVRRINSNWYWFLMCLTCSFVPNFAGYSFGAVSPWKLQRCSCGFAGDDRVLCATARTVLDLNLRNHVTPALWELHWLPITERIQYKLCLLCTRCSSGTLRITLPACWRPPPTFLHGRRCIRRVTVTWSYQERVGRSVTGLSLLLHPVLGISCRLTWNSCVRLLHSRTNWGVFCFMLLTLGTLCELWNAPSVWLQGAHLQVTVVTVTMCRGTTRTN